jgi:hypothetical protein
MKQSMSKKMKENFLLVLPVGWNVGCSQTTSEANPATFLDTYLCASS